MCCRVLDLLQDAKGGTCSSDALAQAVRCHLEQHQRTYGDEQWKPKMHYALHIPQQIERDGLLWDCFVVERSHQLPKLVASGIQNTGTFEKSVIARSLLTRLRELEVFDERPGLRGRQEPWPELQVLLQKDEVMVAARAQYRGLLLSPGDMLFVDGHVIALKAMISADGNLALVGNACNLVSRSSPSASVYSIADGLACYWLGGTRVRRAHMWSELADGNILTLVPHLV